jgi:UDP-N-acetylglucosamine 2-epimerase (non-hydrolysing)
MKILIVVGARPNFMKAAPIIAAIREWNRKNAASSDASESIVPVLLHTGQHYDEAMSGSFFSDLQMPQPDIHLGVGSGSHAVQTAEIMKQFEGVLLKEKPDALLVVGDVNSTVACALVASKVTYDGNGTRPLIIHVEAGLRSGDRAMPEEINRIVTDHLSDILFVTEESGIENLRCEGIAEGKVHMVGNTMIDSLLAYKDKADKSPVLDTLGLRDAAGSVRRYALLTLHRPSNVDARDTFLSILKGIEDLSKTLPIMFSAHPRTRKRITEFGLDSYFHLDGTDKADKPAQSVALANGIHLLSPLGYIDFMCLMKNASIVVTDSGGIQEETTCLGVRCVTVRENTERPVTVTRGTNVIAGTKSENIRKAIADQTRLAGTPSRVPEKWDGKAATRIIDAIIREVGQAKPALAISSHRN